MNTQLLPKWFGIPFALVIVVFLVAPFVVMFLISLTSGQYLSFPWNEGGFSFRWFDAFFSNRTMMTAFRQSFILAVVTAILSVIVASMAALAVVRYSFKLRGLVRSLGMSPLFVPGVMIALSLLIYTSSVLGWRSGLHRMLVGHIAITLPFAMATIVASLTGFDINQEHASYDLGAKRWRTFFVITFPQVKAGFFAATVMAFVVSFDNVAVSIFLVGLQYTTLPVELYFHTIHNLDPLAPAGAMVMIAFSALAIVALEKTFGLQDLLGGKTKA